MSNPRQGSPQASNSPRGMNVLPADINQAQPGFGGGSDGVPAALSIDNLGNLRVTINGIQIGVNTVIPVSFGIGDTAEAAGVVVAPAAGGIIVSLVSAGGVMCVEINAGYGTTADVVNNMQVQVNAAVKGGLYVIPAVNSGPTRTRFWRLTTNPADVVSVNAIVAGAAGSVYIASISMTRVA